jgi:hypothetical protein
MFINEAIEIARNIQYYWDSSDLQTKLKLQKTVFLKGLVRALLRKAQTAARSSFLYFNPLLKVNRTILHFVADGPWGGLY